MWTHIVWYPIMPPILRAGPGCGSTVSRNLRVWWALGLLPLVYPGHQDPVDPLVGRWQLNLGRTHYGGGAEPRTKESFVCEPVKPAIKCTTRSVRADGRTVAGTFIAVDDGTPAPVRGIPDVDQVRLTRIDASIVDATFTQRGKSVLAYRAVRSADGKSLTIISVDPGSRTVLHSVVVYDAR